jgi:hypothetical protein
MPIKPHGKIKPGPLAPGVPFFIPRGHIGLGVCVSFIFSVTKYVTKTTEGRKELFCSQLQRF